jgi:hypothetical protein
MVFDARAKRTERQRHDRYEGKIPKREVKACRGGTSRDLTSSSADHRRMTSEIHLVCTAEDIITEIAVVV